VAAGAGVIELEVIYLLKIIQGLVGISEYLWGIKTTHFKVPQRCVGLAAVAINLKYTIHCLVQSSMDRLKPNLIHYGCVVTYICKLMHDIHQTCIIWSALDEFVNICRRIAVSSICFFILGMHID